MTKSNGSTRQTHPARDEDPRLRAEERERLNREALEKKIEALLPDKSEEEEDEDGLGKAFDPRLVRRLSSYFGPYNWQLFWAVLLMIISSLLSVAGPWIVGRAIDAGIRQGSLETLRFWTWLFIGVALFEFITNRSRIAIMAFVGTKIVADIRSALFSHLHTLSLSFYNQYSVGRLMSRLISDVGVLQEFVTWAITGLARAIFILLGIIAVMLLLNWKLALVTFAVLPLMVLLTNYWRVRVRYAYRSTRERLALINGYLNESISGIRVTKSFSRERENFQHFDDLNRAYYEANLDATKLSALFFPGVDFIGSLATALVIAVGGWLVLQDALTAGTLVAFVLYIDRFFEPIRELAQRYNAFQATMAASERLFQLLDTAPDIQDSPESYPLPPITGRVDFNEVAFGYEDELVLKGITLHAEPGEMIALVGETGAGKSTIIRLLARFFDITGGSIRIDGHDIRQVTQSSLHGQLGIVLQDTFLFSGTIADNIRYGRLEAAPEEIEAAARAVGAHDFISRLPEGYETEVGENGVNLSVGQRQIISFARALLANPRLLILDEATSSVDTTTEKQIQEALDTLMRDRTSFVIAHRLSTITAADKIAVIDAGQIVEIGTHEELLQQQGRYYNLYTMQWDSGRRDHSLN
ncbi:MAG: ABC transporter ATP-binding protein [Ardenticatenales bacterium]|nr:ABC transporter ATP-binding protein [Ardenticatenales bacterium]